MPNEQLLAYIRAEMIRGVTRSDLSRALIVAGWPLEEVNTALTSLNVPMDNKTSMPVPSAPNDSASGVAIPKGFLISVIFVTVVIFAGLIWITRPLNHPVSSSSNTSSNDLQIETPIQSQTQTNIPTKTTTQTKPPPTVAPSTIATPHAFPLSPRNTGAISVRVVVANIAETSTKYGSYSMPFTADKIAEANTAMGRLSAFVTASSYGQMSMSWKTTGVYDLGSGVCSHSSYGEKTDDLIMRALTATDKESPIADYSMYIIVHPEPDCPEGGRWSFEGYGTFKERVINGRTVHLRGIHISNLDDDFLFHEFGHTLGYVNGIGHPGYLQCPISVSGGATHISFSACKLVYDGAQDIIPPFDIMSAKPHVSSDYGALTKEMIGWLVASDFATLSGTYTLASLEKGSSSPKAIKLAIPGGDYFAYLSFRQPNGYTYPAVGEYQSNGVTLELFRKSYYQSSILVVNSVNLASPLAVGTTYELGTNGPTVTVSGISQNQATVRVTVH